MRLPHWSGRSDGDLAFRSRGAARAIIVAAIAVAVALSAIPLQRALAYYSFGTVGVTPGASTLTVQAGGTASTNISVNPASHNQTQGCGMAKCPQVCDSDGAIEAGYHCFDANGQCTCAGPSYSTYYSEVSCVSSNSGVATAYMEGSTLVVTGRSAGTATITVNASLRQWNSGSSTVTVNVTAPAGGGSTSNQPSGGNGGNGGAGDTGSTGGGNGDTTAPDAATPEAAAPSASGIPQAADPTTSKDDGLNEKTVETTAGTVTTVQANSYLDTAAELKKIAGKKAQLIIWSGASSEKPDWSMTFWGEDIDPNNPNLRFDPAITVSDLGTGTAANIVKQAKDARVMAFAYTGDLPANASVYVKAGEKYPDGTQLELFRYDAKQMVFSAEGSEKLKVDGGYFSFTVTKGGTLAVSTDDLASYKVLEENTPGAARKQKAAEDGAAATAATGDSAVSSTDPVLIAGAVAIVVVAAAVIAVVIARRNRARDAQAAEAPAFEPLPVERKPEPAGDDEGTGQPDADGLKEPAGDARPATPAEDDAHAE